LPVVQGYVSNDIVAKAIAIGGIFLGTLLIVSVVTIKISDMILDSRIGALDRTLGFLFGLARGLVIVVVAFLFFVWLVPDRSQPEWVKNAKSRVVLQGTGQWLMSMLPEDPENTILKRFKRPKPEDQDQPDAPAGGRSSLGMPAGRFAAAEPEARRLAVAAPKSQ
jgi:membrane protein required for colicin V production